MKYNIKTIAWIQTIFAPILDANSTTIEIMCKAWSIYETRENNAYIQFLNDDYTYQFDTNKIHYKNYDQAIKSFKKKGNTYTNKDYQIVVTKNKIITTYRGSRWLKWKRLLYYY